MNLPKTISHKNLVFSILSILCYIFSFGLMIMNLCVILRPDRSDPIYVDENVALNIVFLCLFSIIFAISSWILARFANFKSLETIEIKAFYLFVVTICLVRIIYLMPYAVRPLIEIWYGI